MKKSVVSASLAVLMMSSAAYGHDENSCSFSFDHDLKLNNQEITISHADTDTIVIDRNNRLFINSQVVNLDSNQQQLVDSYAGEIRNLVPEVTAIAIEGVSLGIEAASMALGTLLGPTDPDFLEFQFKLQELADSVTMQLDSAQFDSAALAESFDNEFEAKIETFVQETVDNLTPRLMAKVLTSALAGDGAGSDIEARAEAIEQEVTQYIEPRAEALEARADGLCMRIESLDAIEAKLVESGLQQMDLIKTGGEGSMSIKNFDALKKSNYKLSFTD